MDVNYGNLILKQAYILIRITHHIEKEGTEILISQKKRKEYLLPIISGGFHKDYL